MGVGLEHVLGPLSFSALLWPGRVTLLTVMTMKCGFKFDETMSGWYALASAPEERRSLSFTVRAKAESLLRHLRDQRMQLQGTLQADGFADHVPIEGTMILAPLGRRLIRYEFGFTGNDGHPYRFVGQKDISPRSLVRTLTELPAEILDTGGDVVASSLTRFDLRSDLVQFLASWRPA